MEYVAEPAVEIAAGLWRIPTAPFDIVNSFAVVEPDGSVTVIDTGFTFTQPRLLAGLGAIGKAPEDIRRIVLSHAHRDHAGGAARLREATGAQVLLHVDDVPWARRGDAPPSDHSFRSARLFRLLSSSAVPMVDSAFPAFDTDRAFADGDLLTAGGAQVGGGLRVLHTPGHTPGHASFLHEPTGVLLTGDAILNVAGMRPVLPMVCWDYPMTLRTVHVLGEVEYSVVAFMHGPEIRDRARERVRDYIRRAQREERRFRPRRAG